MNKPKIAINLNIIPVDNRMSALGLPFNFKNVPLKIARKLNKNNFKKSLFFLFIIYDLYVNMQHNEQLLEWKY